MFLEKDRHFAFEGTVWRLRRLCRMRNTIGMVMTMAAFVVIASVVMFGKGGRVEPARIAIMSVR
jgi:hypothetical protein